MGYYETMQVCLKGHQITDHYNEWSQFRQDFCNKCGAKTIHECPKCNTPIRGDYVVENFFGGSTPVPYNCHKCGAKYPWARRFKRIAFLKFLFIPFRFLWKLLALAWNHKIIFAIVVGLIVAYIVFRLGW